VAVTTVILALTSASTQFVLVPRAIRQYGEIPTICFGLAVRVVVYLASLAPVTPTLARVSVCLLGFGRAFVSPCLPSMISQILDDVHLFRLGTYLGVGQSIAAAGVVAAGIVNGGGGWPGGVNGLAAGLTTTSLLLMVSSNWLQVRESRGLPLFSTRRALYAPESPDVSVDSRLDIFGIEGRSSDGRHKDSFSDARTSARTMSELFVSANDETTSER
jgi:MFS family permease